ncbi:hypothetical protein L210DRAFT_3553638 [Boletus edulis BED1]|uniref:Uncharacterized protein n=1 Tax=Boletus edulis BED1 TaxID=1328754 RepID=A0AAD4BMF7_BOLED|nr:hypothetical protein L210DRAFT_3553638 [Boletus edulis BED1]
MNRGSILRHIRGVHLSQRQRPSNPVQESLTSEEVGDASSLDNSSTSNVVDPTVRNGSSYAGEDVQMAVESPIYPIIPPFEQLHLTPVGFCEWYNQGGTRTTCGEALARETLTLHLRKHGIERMNRAWLTTCLWTGCEKIVNRECIVRHIREVHLGLKRRYALNTG